MVNDDEWGLIWKPFNFSPGEIWLIQAIINYPPEHSVELINKFHYSFWLSSSQRLFEEFEKGLEVPYLIHVGVASPCPSSSLLVDGATNNEG